MALMGSQKSEVADFAGLFPQNFTKNLGTVPGPKSLASVVLLSPVRYSIDMHQEAI